jgi:hypothetical protein
MTLEGAKKALRGDRSQEPEANVNMELLERLQSLRSMLLAVRESLDEQPEQVAAPVEPKVEVAKDAEVVVEAPIVAENAVEQAPKPKYREQTLFDW